MQSHEFLEHMRQEVREEGFISEYELKSRVVRRAKEHKVNMLPENILAHIPCKDVHVIEYRTTQTKFLPKRLYYFGR